MPDIATCVLEVHKKGARVAQMLQEHGYKTSHPKLLSRAQERLPSRFMLHPSRTPQVSVLGTMGVEVARLPCLQQKP
jgi:hypothetical protein